MILSQSTEREEWRLPVLFKIFLVVCKLLNQLCADFSGKLRVAVLRGRSFRSVPSGLNPTCC